MKFPPEPKTPYVLDKDKNKEIFDKLAEFEGKKLSPEDEELVKFLYSQLEEDWQTPLIEFTKKFLEKK